MDTSRRLSSLSQLTSREPQRSAREVTVGARSPFASRASWSLRVRRDRGVLSHLLFGKKMSKLEDEPILALMRHSMRLDGECDFASITDEQWHDRMSRPYDTPIADVELPVKWERGQTFCCCCFALLSTALAPCQPRT
jgi:hypothetical protein